MLNCHLDCCLISVPLASPNCKNRRLIVFYVDCSVSKQISTPHSLLIKTKLLIFFSGRTELLTYILYIFLHIKLGCICKLIKEKKYCFWLGWHLYFACSMIMFLIVDSTSSSCAYLIQPNPLHVNTLDLKDTNCRVIFVCVYFVDFPISRSENWQSKCLCVP